MVFLVLLLLAAAAAGGIIVYKRLMRRIRLQAIGEKMARELHKFFVSSAPDFEETLKVKTRATSSLLTLTLVSTSARNIELLKRTAVEWLRDREADDYFVAVECKRGGPDDD